LLGIGGGPIKVPVMYIFMKCSADGATATSNFMIGVTAAASAIVLLPPWRHPGRDCRSAGCRIFMGSLLGARLAPRIHTKYVIYLWLRSCIYLAGHLLAHLLAGGAA